jgi:hypothetical protein
MPPELIKVGSTQQQENEGLGLGEPTSHGTVAGWLLVPLRSQACQHLQ